MTTQSKEPKKELTLHEMEQSAAVLVKQDKVLTDTIDEATANRNKLRKELRAINGRILTIKQQEQLKKAS